MNQKIKNEIEEQLKIKISSFHNLSGGCINNAFKLITSVKKFFLLKTNNDLNTDMFIKEANGLNELRKANVIRVPEVFLVDPRFLVLEFIESTSKAKNFFEDFGKRFSEMHKFHSESFGFYEDNYIGSNPQLNIPSPPEEKDWVKFYFNNRILYQYRLAEKNGYITSELRNGISKLENKIQSIIETSEQPALLHGDLWSGNYMADENGFSCLIDPAVYYGNREADLAMTKLFGGFSSAFYSSYNENYPLSDGHEFRENIYKLYHVLNHLNLFGAGYYSQAISLINYYL